MAGGVSLRADASGPGRPRFRPPLIGGGSRTIIRPFREHIHRVWAKEFRETKK